MPEISCEERDRLIGEAFPKDAYGRNDIDRRKWNVGASSTNFMDSGIFETTWVDRETEETVLEDYMERDGHDGWGDIVVCRHYTP